MTRRKPERGHAARARPRVPADKLWKPVASSKEGAAVADQAREAAKAITADAELAVMLVAAGVPAATHAALADACADVLTYLRTPRPRASAAAGIKLAKALDRVWRQVEAFEGLAGIEVRVDDVRIRQLGWLRRSPPRERLPTDIEARPAMRLADYLRGCVDWLETDHREMPTYNPLAPDPIDTTSRPPNDRHDVLRYIRRVLVRYGMGARAHRRNVIVAKIAGHVTGRRFTPNDVTQAHKAAGPDGEAVRRRYSKE